MALPSSGTARYARQRSVPGVGVRGQAQLAAASVSILGDGLDAEICALYLAGAGIGCVRVSPSLAGRCREQNGEITVLELESSAVALRVVLGEETFEPPPGAPLLRGARAARWAMARIFTRAGHPS